LPAYQLNRALVLQAPNVHCGGGFALLKELSITRNVSFKWAQLDERTKGVIELPLSVTQIHVKPSILARLLSEFRLWRNVTIDDVVLCFHGLPPLLPLSGRAVVFIQNRILVEKVSLADYPLRTRLRLWVERFWLRFLQRHAARYIVQTPSMAESLRALLGDGVEICVLPFASLNAYLPIKNALKALPKFDFIYVATGEAHKNHVTLLKAWRLLSQADLRPSLALTVDPLRYPSIQAEILKAAKCHSLNIVNLGQLSGNDISNLYKSSSALIYPSKAESLGLPLLEAANYRLPILAPELDYVRDVVAPVETFDPNSPVSIARAVRRFLGNSEPTVDIHSAEEFLAVVLS